MADLLHPLFLMYILSWVFAISQTVLTFVIGMPVYLCLFRKPTVRVLFGMGWHSLLAIAFASLSAIIVTATRDQLYLGWWYYPASFLFFCFLLASCYPPKQSESEWTAIRGPAILTGLIGFIIFCAWPNLLDNTAVAACERWADWFLSGWWTHGWIGTILMWCVLVRFGVFILSFGVGLIIMLVFPVYEFVTDRQMRAKSRQSTLRVEMVTKRAA
jgi:hypothetical protein